MKKHVKLATLFLAIAYLSSGCYQVQSEDDLRTIPVTNNPNVLPESGGRGGQMPTAGF